MKAVVFLFGLLVTTGVFADDVYTIALESEPRYSPYVLERFELDVKKGAKFYAVNGVYFSVFENAPSLDIRPITGTCDAREQEIKCSLTGTLYGFELTLDQQMHGTMKMLNSTRQVLLLSAPVHPATFSE